MRKLILAAAVAVLSGAALVSTPARANACNTGDTRWVVSGSFWSVFFGGDYDVVEQTCTGYTWR